MNLLSVKGMHDILPGEVNLWRNIEKKYRSIISLFGYQEVRTPVVEPLGLFVRSIGESTDIVEKEMYSFTDKGNKHLALRPEGTASVIRSYIQHNYQAKAPYCKWYYMGPMFRRERPAKGRYRQFHQAGAELIGVDSPMADAEIIYAAYSFLESLKIQGMSVMINSLGDKTTRPLYVKELISFFTQTKSELCHDCLRRLKTNPFRILDCKVPACIKIASLAPDISDFLKDDSKEHFEEVLSLLSHLKIPYTINPRLVRGLDYYTRTIFEIQSDSESVGSNSAILGGGRYDNLVKQLGGKDTPAIGFSFGIDRLLMVLGDKLEQKGHTMFFVAGIGKDADLRIFDICKLLRSAGCIVEASYSTKPLKSQLKKANRLNADVTIIAGEDEAKEGNVSWREMKSSKEQELVSMTDLVCKAKERS